MRGLLRREIQTSLGVMPIWFYMCFVFVLGLNILCESENFATKIFGEHFEIFKAIASVFRSLFVTMGFSYGFFNYGENKHEQYHLTLPYNKAQIITARYILVFIIIFIYGVMSIVGAIISYGIFTYNFLCLSIPILISMPLYYIFGNKLSVVVSTLIMIFSYLISAVYGVVFSEQIKTAFIFTNGFYVVWVVIIAFSFLSWFISVHFYKKRDI